MLHKLVIDGSLFYRAVKRHFSTCIVLLSLLMHVTTVSADSNKSFETASKLYKKGMLNAATTAFSETLKNNPDHYQSLLTLGRLKLYKNEFTSAEKLLKKALTLKKDDKEPLKLLAQVYYRQDRFEEAKKMYRIAGNEKSADLLAGFADKTPYDFQTGKDKTALPFIMTDPLPVIKIRVNGKEVLVVIDTGGPELVLDQELAKEMSIKTLSSHTAVYAGGKKSTTHQGIVENIKLGEFDIANVPVQINNSPKMASRVLGKPIRGILGTVFLYHFISTLDYTHGELILHKKTKQNIEHLKKKFSSSDYIAVPIWLHGRHWILAHGKVNNTGPYLLHVDTGMAGGGFDCTESVRKEADIKMTGKTFKGLGGGGPIEIKEGIVDELSLGSAKNKTIRGLFGGFPPEMEYLLGFRLGGLISHAFFRPFQVTFDFESMKMYIKPNKK